LFMLGLLRIDWLQREFRLHGELQRGRPASAFLLGVAFAFGWTPCIGPILGSILTVSAAVNSTAGASLLAIYSLGLAIPFITAAMFTDWFFHHMRRVRKFSSVLHRVAGLLLVIMGIAMMTGYLTSFSIWLLKTFPWLEKLG